MDQVLRKQNIKKNTGKMEKVFGKVREIRQSGEVGTTSLGIGCNGAQALLFCALIFA